MGAAVGTQYVDVAKECQNASGSGDIARGHLVNRGEIRVAVFYSSWSCSCCFFYCLFLIITVFIMIIVIIIMVRMIIFIISL